MRWSCYPGCNSTAAAEARGLCRHHLGYHDWLGQGRTWMMAGFAAGLDMVGFCATGTSAPADSPGPSGGTEMACTLAHATLNASASHSQHLLPRRPVSSYQAAISPVFLLLCGMQDCWSTQLCT